MQYTASYNTKLDSVLAQTQTRHKNLPKKSLKLLKELNTNSTKYSIDTRDRFEIITIKTTERRATKINKLSLHSDIPLEAWKIAFRAAADTEANPVSDRIPWS